MNLHLYLFKTEGPNLFHTSNISFFYVNLYDYEMKYHCKKTISYELQGLLNNSHQEDFRKTKLCYFLMGSDVTNNISNKIDFPSSTNSYVLCTTYVHSTKLDGMI